MWFPLLVTGQRCSYYLRMYPNSFCPKTLGKNMGTGSLWRTLSFLTERELDGQFLWNWNFIRNAHILASKYLCPNCSVLVCCFFFFLISSILKAKFPSGLLGLRNVVWHSDKRIVENKQVEVLKGMKKSGIILHSFLSMLWYLRLDKAGPIYSSERWDW